MRASVLVGGALGAAALVLSGCAGTTAETDGSKHNSSLSPGKGGDGAAPAESSFANDVLTTPDMKVKITDYKVIPVGAKGNEYGSKPVIAFWYQVTNLSEEELDPSTAWIVEFEAFQDNNPNAENRLEVGMLPDDRFLESQSENIKKGGTVESAIAYELDDTKTPVDLTASEDLGSTEVGTVTYRLK